MNGLGQLFKKIDEQKPLVTPSKKWPWANRKKFGNGRYRVRFISHDEKCPDGFRIYTIHEIQKEACDKWSMSLDEQDKAYYKVMCTESYKGYTEDAEGNSKLASPCAVCDVAWDIIETYRGEDLDEDILKAVDEMSSNACRRFLYPMLVYATETEVTDDEGKKRKLYVPDDRNCVGVILNLLAKNYEGNADLTLIKLLHQHVFDDNAYDNAEINLSPRKGRWFTWEKKSNGQSLSPEDKQPLTDKEGEVLAKLSNIAQFGMGTGEGKFVKNYKVGYEKSLSMLQQSWAIKALTKYHGYDMDSVTRGIV